VNDPMTILKADHREAKKLMTELADSDRGRQREQLAARLDAALTLHMDIEEQLVYPVVAEHVGDEDETEAEIEHGLARTGLATMVAMVAQPGFGAAVEMLKGGIMHHVEEEETEILPQLKQRLSRAEWLRLGDAMAAAKTAAGVPAQAIGRQPSTGPASTRPSTRRPTKPTATATKVRCGVPTGDAVT
jgi:hemerythrin-like domain-containing protein